MSDIGTEEAICDTCSGTYSIRRLVGVDFSSGIRLRTQRRF
jgi:hypothetical protein